MITKITGEAPFQVLTNNFSISPSNEGYTLQISADGENFSNLFTVAANTTRLVTGVAANSYYRLSGNQSEVVINWMKTCVTSGGGSGATYTAGDYISIANDVISVTGITPEDYMTSGDTETMIQEALSGFTPSGDMTQLQSVSELPQSAETGTVMALADSGVPYVGYWVDETRLAEDGETEIPVKVFYFYLQENSTDPAYTGSTQVEIGRFSCLSDESAPLDTKIISFYYDEEGGNWKWHYRYENYDYEGDDDYENTPIDDIIHIIDPETGDEIHNYGEMEEYEVENIGNAYRLVVGAYIMSSTENGWYDYPLDNTYIDPIEGAGVGLYQYDGTNWNEAGNGVIELTQAEYDALSGQYASNTTYIITDAEAINMDDYAKQADLTTLSGNVGTALAGKADKTNVTANTNSTLFPTWNEQGVITGVKGSANDRRIKVNGSQFRFFSSEGFDTPMIYAPTSTGTAGQPLLSNGSGAPVWGTYKFAFISQTDYDALTTKDSSTIYFITGD